MTAVVRASSTVRWGAGQGSVGRKKKSKHHVRASLAVKGVDPLAGGEKRGRETQQK